MHSVSTLLQYEIDFCVVNESGTRWIMFNFSQIRTVNLRQQLMRSNDRNRRATTGDDEGAGKWLFDRFYPRRPPASIWSFGQLVSADDPFPTPSPLMGDDGAFPTPAPFLENTSSCGI